MNMFIIQLIGGIGYASLAISFFQKKKEDILKIQIIAYLFFTIHYYLLDAYTGMICNILGLLSLILIYLFVRKGNDNLTKKLLYIIIPIVVIASLLSYQNIYSIFIFIY